MSKWKDIEHCIEQEMLAGTWKLGERLPSERQLAERFAVTRNTLRMALGSLAAQGILETRHGSGSRICSLPNGRTEIGTAGQRIASAAVVMPAVACECAKRIQPSQVNRLEEKLASIGMALRADDAKGFVRGGLGFLGDIAAMAGNTCLEAAAACVLPEPRSLYRAVSSSPLQRREMLFALLARLLGALRRSDADEAGQAARRYFQELSSVAEQKP